MANEDKIFDLIEKLYIEMQNNFKTVNEKLDQKSDKADIVKFENDIEPKFSALFDGYK